MVEAHGSGQRGLFFCSLPLDAIINGREHRDREPIRFRLACQPKTNCLLALTAGFYLHNSNPKAICSLPTLGSAVVFTRSTLAEAQQTPSKSESQWMKPCAQMNQSRSQSHFEPGEHLRLLIVAIRSSESPVHFSVSRRLHKASRLFWMIMQILLNRCH